MGEQPTLTHLQPFWGPLLFTKEDRGVCRTKLTEHFAKTKQKTGVLLFPPNPHHREKSLLGARAQEKCPGDLRRAPACVSLGGARGMGTMGRKEGRGSSGRGLPVPMATQCPQMLRA